MADNTRLKELQAAVKTHSEEIGRIANTMDVKFSEHNERMNQIQVLLNQILQNTAKTHGSPSSSGVSGISGITTSSGVTPVKEISLGFPHFDGTTPVLEWIFKAEKFFMYHNTPDAARVDIAAMHFDKEVVPWFQMLHRIAAINSWSDLTRAMESQFGPSPYDCPMADLFKLTQTGSISEYYLQFMALANRSIGLTDEALLNCFVGGLKTEIKRDVVAMVPPTLLRAVALARLYEDRYYPTSRSVNTNYTHRYSAVTANTATPNAVISKIASKPSLPSLLPTPVAPPLKHTNVKRISPTEMQLRREKGLCYFCDEKFSFNHKCPNRQLLFLQLEEENEDSTKSQVQLQTVSDSEQNIDHHLSLNALKGGIGIGTIRFLAYIDKLAVIVLIDGGSSDNFLQPRVAKFLKLPIEPAPMFKVMVGNGNYMEAEGLVKQLRVQAQGNLFQLPVFLLPISGADLILGASWLKTIGPHIADYDALQLKFLVAGKFHTLQGDSSLVPQQAQLHHIRRMMTTNSIAEVYSMQVSDETPLPKSMLDLPTQMELELALLLHTYSVVFDTPTSLPPQRSHDHTIPLLEGSQPVKVKPYRYPHSQKEEIEKLVNDMLAEGIIQPSKSPFSSPIILVKKKDGSWRVCTDYRALNAITIKDSFPIPTVDELIDELFGAKFFSKLDLRAGYHQILLNPDDRHKTAFRTHHGHYEWLVMPFGLTNAPTTFQCLMNDIFPGLLRKFVLVFFDDILVYSVTWKDHLQHLEVVLNILKQHQLFARFSKCCFGLQQIDYLGHTLSGSGIAMDEMKLEAIQRWPIPTNLKQMRGFLGLTGYYRRFIKSYATIAAPLTDLLKKDSFVWSPSATHAFETLKQAMTFAPVLTMPNFKEPFVLETDASGSGIGAVLSQNMHPIAYFSKKLLCRMQKQFAYAREFYVITEAMAKFRHYLLGHKFIIKTDQKSLKELLEQRLQTPEQQQWLPKFLGYDFTIQYKPGKENIPADALSRTFFYGCFGTHSCLAEPSD